MNTPARTLAAALMLTTGLAAAEEFKFDASEFEKKTVEFSGYVEQKEEGLKLRSNTPAYALAYPGAARRKSSATRCARHPPHCATTRRRCSSARAGCRARARWR